MLSALIDSRSRWLVGSSKTSTLGFCSINLQNSSRLASPPERISVRLSASSRGNSSCPWLDQRFVVLSKVSNRGLVPPDDLSVVQEWAVVAAGLAQFCFRHGGRV